MEYIKILNKKRDVISVIRLPSQVPLKETASHVNPKANIGLICFYLPEISLPSGDAAMHFRFYCVPSIYNSLFRIFIKNMNPVGV